MRIDGIGAMLPRLLIMAAQRAPAGGGAGDLPAIMPDSAAGPTLGNPAIGSVQMLVAMTAPSPREERRRKAAQRAASALDALAALEASTILGQPAPESVAALTAWSEALPETDDPALRRLLADIDLRVRVELAKLDRQI